MLPDEQKAYSLLYDEVGGSLSMSQEWLTTHNDLNDNQTDIEDNAINVSESTELKTMPEAQFANSTLETSILNFGSPAKAIGTPSGQPDTTVEETSTNNFHNVTNTDKWGCKILWTEDHNYCTNEEILTSAQQLKVSCGGIDTTCRPISHSVDKSNCKNRFTTQSVDSVISTDNLDIQHIVSSNNKERLAIQPVGLDYDKSRMAKELFDIFADFIKENKNIILDRNVSANSSKPLHENHVNFKSITKPSDKEQLKNSGKVSEMSCKESVLPTIDTGSIKGHGTKRFPAARTLDFSTHMPNINKSLHKEPTSTNETFNEQLQNTHCVKKQLNEHMKPRITSKISSEHLKHFPSTSKAKDFSEDQTAQDHRSEVHPSLSTTGSGSRIGQSLHSLTLSKKGFSSLSPENSTFEKGTLFRPHSTFNAEALPLSSDSPDVGRGKTSLHAKETPQSSYISPQQLKEISAQLRKGSFSKTFSGMVPQIQNSIESAKKTQPQTRYDVISTEESLEHNMSLQLAERHPPNPSAHQRNTDEAVYEGPSEPNILSQTARHSNNFDPNHRNTGFPAKTELYLNIEQKSLLLESYNKIKKQMETTNIMEGGAARIFWNLCLESKCREFLLTMLINHTESVINKIIHEKPNDKDYEQAFLFLQASGYFEDFIKGDDRQTRMSSSIASKEPFNENKSSIASSPSILASHGELENQKVSNNKDQVMELELPKTSLCSESLKGEMTRDEDKDRMETCSPETSLSSLSACSTMNEMLSQTSGGNRLISDVQLTVLKMLQDLNTQRSQQQDEDGDAAFARSLVPFLRKIPENKKLHTRIALQNVLISALSQNPQ